MVDSIDASLNGRVAALGAKLDAAREASRAKISETLAAGGSTFYVNADTGSDQNPGTSKAQPLRSLAEALARSREPGANRPVTVVLAASQTHRLLATLELGPSDSGLALVADPDAEAGAAMPTVSGGQPLKITGPWEALDDRRAAAGGDWIVMNSTNAVYGADPSPSGPVINLTRTADAAACQVLCEQHQSPSGNNCSVFTWHDSTWPIEYKNTCWIRLDGLWQPTP